MANRPRAWLDLCSRAWSDRPPEKHDDNEREKYLLSLHMQFLLRFLDFLSINMVLPSLPDYMQRLGGHTEDYYRCLEAYSFSFIIGTAILGMVVDGGGDRMLPSYIGTAVLVIAGNTLFSVAGSVAVLQRPSVLVLARCLVGLGASNAVLAMIFVTEVCEGFERQKWVIRFGITRSQGLFWGPTVGMALAALTSSKTGMWGADTAAGWFQASTVAATVAALVVSWPSLPREEIERGSLRVANFNSKDLTLHSFLLQWRVLGVLLVMATAATAQMACEVMIPVMCQHALGWTGPMCGTPLSAMAVLLTLGQLCLVRLTKRGVEDRALLLLGAALFPAVLLSTALLWLADGALDEVKVLGPFMLIAMIGPFAVLGSMAVFMRLSMEQVPGHRGKCQALQNNLLAFTNMAAPAWLSFSYSGELLTREKVPCSCLAWLGFVELLALAAVLSSYADLRPQEVQEHVFEPAAPLLHSLTPERLETQRLSACL